MGKPDLASGFALPKHTKPRQAPDDRAAERFVTAGSRRRKEGGERIAVYLPSDVAEALRIQAVRGRRSVSDAVTEAVVAWLQRAGP